jgi:HK97 family phage prohead protease
VTGVADDGRTFEARAVAYNVIDDYNTRFAPGVFDESLAARLPVIAWAHSWDEPIGRVTAYESRDDGLYVTARLSDPDAVPRARQAMSQLADGTLDDVSVGFMREASNEADDGIVDITKATLDEISVVLRGAVPGAKVLAVRSTGTVDVDAVVELARRKVAGEITEDEAKAALELLAEDAEAPESPLEGSESDETGQNGTEPPEDVQKALEAELDEALEAIGRSSW